MGGNSWTLDKNSIRDQGYIFNSIPAKFVTYFYGKNTKAPTSVDLSIKLKSSALLNVTVKVGSTSRIIKTDILNQFRTYLVGKFNFTNGYNRIYVTLSGINLTSNGIFESIIINGTFSETTFVDNNIDSMYYWGRRGASCHLGWFQTGYTNIKYMYSQINVPLGFDPIGSYYMANGFNGGYFGIQVNSPTQRRILFSIWKDQTSLVNLIKKGTGVYSGQFGGQGQGGQSYLVYSWKPAITYSFLTKAQPLGTSTIFTAWFNDPETPGWKLIAQWQKTNLSSYLQGLYSFLQCFSTQRGNITRQAYYGNQWIFDSSNQWKQVTQITFTKDNTGNSNQRRDVQGGVYAEGFYMKNDGFFNTTVSAGTTFTRTAKKIKPNITFTQLP